MKSTTSLLCLLALAAVLPGVSAWQNGKFVNGTTDHLAIPTKWQYDENFGTHDFLLAYAISFLPEGETKWISKIYAYYGTELPDTSLGSYKIYDSACCQHIYFDKDQNVVDPIDAIRADYRYKKAVDFLKKGKTAMASMEAGVMSHYITVVGVWGNVMGANTTFGGPKHHLDFISVINHNTWHFPSVPFDKLYGQYVKFDGLDVISAYDATIEIARDTAFGECGAWWMDNHYDLSDPKFNECLSKRFNLIINDLADVLHTMYLEANGMLLGEQPVEQPTIGEGNVTPPVGEGETNQTQTNASEGGNAITEPPSSEQPPVVEQPPVQPYVAPEKGGDNTTVYLMIILMVVAIVFLSVLLASRRKRRSRVQEHHIAELNRSVVELKNATKTESTGTGAEKVKAIKGKRKNNKQKP